MLSVKVAGQEMFEIPNDLYIPPDAMQVMVEVFEGPFDLLLYLIRKHNLDILDIPVSTITHQYIKYIELMQDLKLELAAEYLEMAAILAEIKSRMLLPKPANDEEGEEIDPRAELVRRLQEYEQIKQAAENLDNLPRIGRDSYLVEVPAPAVTIEKPLPEVDMDELIKAFRDILKRADLQSSHSIGRETLTVREKMSYILSLLDEDNFVEFIKFFNLEEGRLGVVVTFLAILELSKETVVEIVQSEPYCPVYVRLKS